MSNEECLLNEDASLAVVARGSRGGDNMQTSIATGYLHFTH